jgi:hypothetical protein
MAIIYWPKYLSRLFSFFVQFRYSGGVVGAFAAWLLGEKAGHHPTKREPLRYRIILMDFPEWR